MQLANYHRTKIGVLGNFYIYITLVSQKRTDLKWVQERKVFCHMLYPSAFFLVFDLFGII